MIAEAGGSVALRVPPGEPVVCDLGGDGSRTVLALVSSMSGQPGAQIVDRTQPGGSTPRPVTMAVGRHGAVAVAVGVRQAAAAIWQAEPSVEPLEVRLQQFSYRGRQPEPAPFGTLSGSVAGPDSLVYQLPPGTKRLQLALGEGVVAVLWNEAGVESVHWAGGPAFAETLDTTAARIILLRAGVEAGSFSVNVLPSSEGEPTLALGTDRPFESVEATAGILRLTVPRLDAPAGNAYTVHIRGASEAVLLGADGRVRHGREITAGSSGGSLLLWHGPGRLLCWLDSGGGLAEALWGLVGNLTATTVDPPVVLSLHGKAMLVRVELGHPALLHLRTVTPVATRLVRPEGEPEIELHPNGCMLDAYLPSGSAELGLRAVSGLELAGSAELTASEVTAIDEGLGPESLLPPGETRGFSFTVDPRRARRCRRPRRLGRGHVHAPRPGGTSPRLRRGPDDEADPWTVRAHPPRSGSEHARQGAACRGRHPPARYRTPGGGRPQVPGDGHREVRDTGPDAATRTTGKPAGGYG